MSKYRKVIQGIEDRTGSGYELFVWDDGDLSYFFNNKYHREDGPAFAPSSNNKQWYLKGKRLDKDWFIQNPDKINEMKAWELFEPEELVSLKLTGKP